MPVNAQKAREIYSLAFSFARDAFSVSEILTGVAASLAVVAGLTLAGASAISHNLYVGGARGGNLDEQAEVKVAKVTTVGLGLISALVLIVL